MLQEIRQAGKKYRLFCVRRKTKMAVFSVSVHLQLFFFMTSMVGTRAKPSLNPEEEL